MNIGNTNYGELYSSLEQADSLGISREDVIELTREVIEQTNPRYPINHQSQRECLRRLKQLSKLQKSEAINNG